MILRLHTILLLGILHLPWQIVISQFPIIEMISNKKVLEIPFEYHQGLIIIDVTVEGVTTLPFIFDTGSEETTFFEGKMATLFGWQMHETIDVVGSDFKTKMEASIARNVNLSFTKGHSFKQDIIVMDQSLIPFQSLIGIPISGIIGASFLRGATFQIDYQKHKIKFFHPQFPPKDLDKYASQKLSILENRPYIDAQLSVIEGDTSQIRLLLDTGAAIHLLVNHNTIENLRISETISNGYLASGLGGILGGYVGTVRYIGFANANYQSIPIYFQKIDSTLLQLSKTRMRNGIIGNILLKDHVVILDFLRHQAYFKSGYHKQPNFKINKSGMTIFKVGKDHNEFLVHQIHEESNAYKAGIRKGDYILSINKRPKFLLSIEFINNRLSGKSGKRIKIKYKRGLDKKKTSFQLMGPPN